eukprot:CAMPEP_0114256898 /NCGR_PEP_ID=MMETSP0058-20121206/18426_1 /TAXON_ID=36894 /ORGANISM="Pyramimonas parkeae, CCMP726" /LENGTH=336 /DNA_ID=CAMNT_0001371551 /DNA_START=13 /DNA_END=1023 /DNA_ORIENTATION=+
MSGTMFFPISNMCMIKHGKPLPQRAHATRKVSCCAHGILGIRLQSSRLTSSRGRTPVLQRAGPESAPVAEGEGLEDLSQSLSLDNIRASLIRQEDSIIFSFIERAQFKRNDKVYRRDAIPVPVYHCRTQERFTFLEFFLRENEQLWGKMRRYTSPDEVPFYPGSLPSLILPPLKYPKVLVDPDHISLNDEILDLYVNTLVPEFTEEGNDNNYGSAAMYDCMCLQALSKRIHYGKFVAEAKFKSDRATYTPLIEAQDAEGLMALLTFPKVEQDVIDRVTKKARMIGRDLDSDGSDNNTQSYKVQPEAMGKLYKDWVMPLTKKVQVKYLLQRLENENK